MPIINTILNRRPVVTYEKKSGHVDPNSQQIMCIAFDHAINYTQGQGICAAFYAHNSNGKPFSSPPVGLPNFLFYQVPTNVNDLTYRISVSGELSEKFMYSFANFHQDNVNHKEVTSFHHIRQGYFANTEAPSVKCVTLHNNFLPMFFSEINNELQWIDTQGKLLCTNISEVPNTLANIKPGISYISYQNQDGYLQKVKIIKL